MTRIVTVLVVLTIIAHFIRRCFISHIARPLRRRAAVTAQNDANLHTT